MTFWQRYARGLPHVVDGRFKQIVKVLIILVAVLIILMRALPLIGVSL
jgi:hypothetical protein